MDLGIGPAGGRGGGRPSAGALLYRCTPSRGHRSSRRCRSSAPSRSRSRSRAPNRCSRGGANNREGFFSGYAAAKGIPVTGLLDAVQATANTLFTGRIVGEEGYTDVAIATGIDLGGIDDLLDLRVHNEGRPICLAAGGKHPAALALSAKRLPVRGADAVTVMDADRRNRGPDAAPLGGHPRLDSVVSSFGCSPFILIVVGMGRRH